MPSLVAMLLITVSSLRPAGICPVEPTGIITTLSPRAAANLAKRVAIVEEANRELHGQYSERGSYIEGWIIKVSTRSKVVNQGQPIIVSISLKNLTHKTQKLVEYSMALETAYGYQVVVTDRSGQKMPLTDYGRIVCPDPFSMIGDGMTRRFYRLSAGQTEQRQMQVDRICQMTSPGVYSMRVQELIPKPAVYGWVLLESDPIRVTVLKIHPLRKRNE